ncbi:MAG: hypothetical protein NWR72_18615 [Bacteroidia bacterium]|nr:hypothetical protein [Bacteroidia bacterium]
MIPARHILLTGILLVTILAWLPAQQARSTSDWFLRQAFLLADFNGDGQLSLSETPQMCSQLDYYSTEKGFGDSDHNSDQLLSFEEVKATAWQAMVHRLSADEQELIRLKSQYSHLGEAQIQYLRRYPGLSSRLLANVVWTREHLGLVTKLSRDRTWLRENPEAADALQNNLIFWVEHPFIAREYYERPPAGNVAALYEAWRSLHRPYLQAQNKLPSYLALDFPYTAIPEKEIVTESSDRPIVAIAESRRTSGPENIVDSMKTVLKAAEDKIKRLENVIAALSSTQESGVSQSSNAEQELRRLRIEQKLARIEEDSLLATTIRQRKYITYLEGRLTTDSLQYSQPVQDMMTERRNLEKDLSGLKLFVQSQARYLDSLNHAFLEKDLLLRKEQQKLAALTQVQAEQQSSVSASYQSLTNSLSSLRDSLQESQSSSARLAHQHQSNRLVIDSLRLELLQSNLRRQSLMDSMLYLNQIARIKYDSLAFLMKVAMDSPQPILHADTRAYADSLLMALRRAEQTRHSADLFWQMKLDSMSLLLANTQSPHIAYRTSDEPESNEVIAAIRKTEAALRYDNQKLREQLDVMAGISQNQETILREQINAVLKNNRRLEYQNRQLSRRLDSRRVPSSTVAIDRMDAANFELQETKSKVEDLERLNETLLLQLQASQAYILQRLPIEQQSNDRLGKEMAGATSARYKADTLSIALANALRNSWPDTVNLLRVKIQEMERENKVLERRAVNARSLYLQQRDSLTDVINQKDLELIRKQQTSSVDLQRITKIEAKEAELNALENRLLERKQLLDQREQVIIQKTEETAIKEARYQQLDQWEADLKKREQKLRNQGGGNN